jgi:hypothetical protein
MSVIDQTVDVEKHSPQQASSTPDRARSDTRVCVPPSLCYSELLLPRLISVGCGEKGKECEWVVLTVLLKQRARVAVGSLEETRWNSKTSSQSRAAGGPLDVSTS